MTSRRIDHDIYHDMFTNTESRPRASVFSTKVIYCKPDPTKISEQQMSVFLFCLDDLRTYLSLSNCFTAEQVFKIIATVFHFDVEMK